MFSNSVPLFTKHDRSPSLLFFQGSIREIVYDTMDR